MSKYSWRWWAIVALMVVGAGLGIWVPRLLPAVGECGCGVVGSPNDADVVAQRWSQYLTEGDFEAAFHMLYLRMDGMYGAYDPSSDDLIVSADGLLLRPKLVDRYRPGASPDTLIHGTPAGHVYWVVVASTSTKSTQSTLVLLVDDRTGSPTVLTDVQVIKVFASGVEQIDLDAGGPTLRFASPVPGPAVSGDVRAPLDDRHQWPTYVVVGAQELAEGAEWLPPAGPDRHGIARFSQSSQHGPAVLVAIVNYNGGFLYAATPVLINDSKADTPAPSRSLSRVGPTLLNS
jgi:hypothetical protein